MIRPGILFRPLKLQKTKMFLKYQVILLQTVRQNAHLHLRIIFNKAITVAVRV
jgi:hypothetical protein